MCSAMARRIASATGTPSTPATASSSAACSGSILTVMAFGLTIDSPPSTPDSLEAPLYHLDITVARWGSMRYHATVIPAASSPDEAECPASSFLDFLPRIGVIPEQTERRR